MTFFTVDQPVLFVDDDASLRQANVQSLELAGLTVQPFEDAQTALAAVSADFAGVVVSDIRMPRMDGLQLFAHIHAIDPDIPVILISGHADVPMAVGALRDGVFDFVTKPFSVDQMIASVQKALGNRRLVLDNRRLRAAAEDNVTGGPLIGESPGMVRLRETIRQVAAADFDVLIEGETGTGKELVAVLLHRWGPRRTRPFVPVNCGALPEQFVESELFGHEFGAVAHAKGSRTGRILGAHRGTLFLDEIDSTPMSLQIKLLRFLEEREVTPVGGDNPRNVDLRVVAASKRDLQKAAAEGEFRPDLLYRLNVVRLHIPPLRERKEDIPLLFAHFASLASKQLGRSSFTLTDAARRHLLEHDWPGNVRELRNFAYRVALDLPDPEAEAPADPTMSLPRRVERFEAALVREAMTAARGDIRSVMTSLGIPRKTLYDKLGRHGINPDDFRRPGEGGTG